MKEFKYVIQDKIGIHARSAGLLVQEAGKYASDVTVHKGDKNASAKKLFALMGMAVKCGDEVTVTVSGGDEEAAFEAMKRFFEHHF